MTITQERTALYRLLAANGRLLYVGISSNPDFRWGTHSNKQPWWDEVADRKVEWFPSREAAAVAEVEAIREERPLYNKQHSVTRHVTRQEQPERHPVQSPMDDDPWAEATPHRRFRLVGEQTPEGLRNVAIIEAAFEMGLLTDDDLPPISEEKTG